MECRFCRQTRKDGFYTAVDCKGIEYVDQCPRPVEPVPKLSEENRRFWVLFEKIMPGLFDGFGGFSYRAIEIVFDYYNVPAGQRQILFDRCLIVIAVIQSIREKERDRKTQT